MTNGLFVGGIYQKQACVQPQVIANTASIKVAKILKMTENEYREMRILCGNKDDYLGTSLEFLTPTEVKLLIID